MFFSKIVAPIRPAAIFVILTQPEICLVKATANSDVSNELWSTWLITDPRALTIDNYSTTERLLMIIICIHHLVNMKA